jgi:2,4-dienoyl-CoA reductase (NADPH2)
MNTFSGQMPAKCHDPIDIGNVRIKNRIARSSLAGITDGEFGEVLEPRIGFEETYAQGGVGLIISSHVPIRADGRVLPNYAMIDNDERIPEWRRLVDAVHAYNTKYFLQLSHSGRQQDLGGIQNINYGQGQLDMRPPSPGSLPDPFHGLAGRMLDVNGMKQMVQDFIAAARRAAAAGVDGLELHSSNGYFFTQVISSSSNDRAKHDPNDPYGGELKNRFRFWDEVIRGIKNDPEARHLPLIVKLSVIEDASALRPWRPKGFRWPSGPRTRGPMPSTYRQATFFRTRGIRRVTSIHEFSRKPMPGCACAENTADSTSGCSTMCPSSLA